jgi:hypothetical protein
MILSQKINCLQQNNLRCLAFMSSHAGLADFIKDKVNKKEALLPLTQIS